MSRIIEEHWRELLMAMLISWMGWLSYNEFTTQSRVLAMELNSTNVIPSAVEKSLAEIRTRMNEEQKERTELLMLAHDNAKDIRDILQRLDNKR